MKQILIALFAALLLSFTANARAQSPVFGPTFGPGSGDTITSPDSSLTVSGTNTATQVIINAAHTTAYTVAQTFLAGANFGFNPGLLAATPSNTYALAGKYLYDPSNSLSYTVASEFDQARFNALSGNALGGLFASAEYTGSPEFVVGTAGTAGLGMTDSAISDTLLAAPSGKETRIGIYGSASTMQVGTQVTIPSIKATTGTRYVCVDTSGNITSSATACSGT